MQFQYIRHSLHNDWLLPQTYVHSWVSPFTGLDYWTGLLDFKYEGVVINTPTNLYIINL